MKERPLQIFAAFLITVLLSSFESLPIYGQTAESKLVGTVFGSPGSLDAGNPYRDYRAVFDGNIGLNWDASQKNSAEAGLDLKTGNQITFIRYYPRFNKERVVGGVFQGANNEDFSDAVTFHTITEEPPVWEAWYEISIEDENTYTYVRYVAPDLGGAGSFGGMSEIEFYGFDPEPEGVALTGTVIGTEGLRDDDPNKGRDAVFDGDIATFFDAIPTTGWAGLDFGDGQRMRITKIRYVPREGEPTRMKDGIFQGANTEDFTNAEDLHTIYEWPTEGLYSQIHIVNAASFRYVRYLAPAESHVNVSEVEFYGVDVSDQIDKVALTASIEDAETVLTAAEDFQYQDGAKTTFQAEIDAAIAIRDNETATQAEVDAAVLSLTAAITAFNEAKVDKTALNEAVAAANTLHSETEATDYMPGAWDAFGEAIAVAVGIQEDGSASQEEINAAVEDLAAATAAFNGAKGDKSELIAGIDAAQLLLDDANEADYMEGALVTYQEEINAAILIRDDATVSMEEVDAAVAALAVATANFEFAAFKDRTDLNDAIAAAQSEQSGAPEELFRAGALEKYLEAINVAIAERDNEDATPEEIDAAYRALAEAIAVFHDALLTEMKLTGKIFGTAGEWSGNTTPPIRDYSIVYDGNIGSTWDSPQGDNAVTGVDFGAGYRISRIRFHARSAEYLNRVDGGVFEASNDENFNEADTLHIITNSTFEWLEFITSNSDTYRYVRYVGPNGSFGGVAEIEYYGSYPEEIGDKLSGTVIGATGNSDAAFDGNLLTTYESEDEWIGLDLGEDLVITKIRFVPGSGGASQMYGSVLEGANTEDFSDAEALLPVKIAPKEGILTEGSAFTRNSYRYVRYLAPDGASMNIAELAFYGMTVDNTVLVEAIAAAETLHNEAADADYVEGARAVFMEAINAATGVRDNTEARQGEIDDAVEALAAATAAFNKAQLANKTALTNAIAEAQELHDNTVPSDDNQAAAKVVFQDAINAAIAVRDNENATAAEVEAAMEVLADASSTFNSSLLTGLKEELFTSLKVYPNPVENQYLFIENADDITAVALHSITGVMAYSTKINHGIKHNAIIEIDVSGLSRGLYIIKLTNKEGDFGTHRIVIK